MDKETYLQWTAESRARRLRWFQDARFGMFVHWGLYSQIGRHEWVMNRECIPQAEYERLADTWKPIERPARAWARLAKQAGMKYMVMTTKHHEGFCLWDTQQTDYNAVKRGPGRDLVREYVEACREFDLKHPQRQHRLLLGRSLARRRAHHRWTADAGQVGDVPRHGRADSLRAGTAAAEAQRLAGD